MADLNIQNATPDQKQRMLNIAIETRRFEIERFWARSLFFWGFIAATFVAYVDVYDRQADGVPFIVACFGVVCSAAWTLANRGSKYWQEQWEHKVEILEHDVLGALLFKNPEPFQRKGVWGAARYSVSKLTILLSDFMMLVWVALAMRATPWPLPIDEAWCVAVIFTGVYVVLLLVFGRSTGR